MTTKEEVIGSPSMTKTITHSFMYALTPFDSLIDMEVAAIEWSARADTHPIWPRKGTLCLVAGCLVASKGELREASLDGCRAVEW
jgi:hypothetical protein